MAFKAIFSRFHERNILLRSCFVRAYCNFVYKVLMCYFALMYELELMTLKNGKNAGIRPFFGQNRWLGGVLFRRITVPHFYCHKFFSKWASKIL